MLHTPIHATVCYITAIYVNMDCWALSYPTLDSAILSCPGHGLRKHAFQLESKTIAGPKGWIGYGALQIHGTRQTYIRFARSYVIII